MDNIENEILKINLLDVANHIKDKFKEIKRKDIKVYLTMDKDIYTINIKNNKPYNHIFKYIIDNDIERMFFSNNSSEVCCYKIIKQYNIYLFRRCITPLDMTGGAILWK